MIQSLEELVVPGRVLRFFLFLHQSAERKVRDDRGDESLLPQINVVLTPYHQV